MICIALMTNEVKLILCVPWLRPPARVSMVDWTQLHFIAHLSAAFISGRGERLSLFGPL